MAIELTDMLNQGKANPSGTKLLVSFAPISHFLSIKKPLGSAGADNTDLVTIKTDHTFKTGKRFLKLEVEMNKNDYNAEQQGAVLGGSQKPMYTGFVSNLTPEILGGLTLAKREGMIALVHLADDQVLQLGQENNSARLSYNSQVGLSEGGERGNAITIQAFHDTIFYQGAISYIPAP